MLVIRKIRRDLDITQKQLAETVGVEQQTVCGWERGRFEPRMSMLPRIAEALGCTIDDLFDESKGKTSGKRKKRATVCDRKRAARGG